MLFFTLFKKCFTSKTQTLWPTKTTLPQSSFNHNPNLFKPTFTSTASNNFPWEYNFPDNFVIPVSLLPAIPVSDKPVVSRSKKQTVQLSISFLMSLVEKLVGGGMVVILFMQIISKPTELSYATPFLSCCWLPELLLLSAFFFVSF